MINTAFIRIYIFCLLIFVLTSVSCKHKRKTQTAEKPVIVTDSTKCKLDFKSAKTLTKHIKENEFAYDWISAKANVETNIDGDEKNFDVRVRIRRDSSMLITIQALSLVDVAKVLITKDSVKLVDYIHKSYFRGDFNYINEMLNADLDYEVIQAVLFGNSAEFYDDDTRLKPVTDKQNCRYLLSTERKRRLRKIQNGGSELKKALQIITLNPENYKILNNEFIDPSTNRIFIAAYKDFKMKDSVYAPYHVDIDIVAEKRASVKIDYVRIEKNVQQKLTLNIPSKYEEIKLQKKQ